MKMSGEAQAELIKIAAIGAAVLVAVYFVRKGAMAVAEAPGQVIGGILSDVASQPVYVIADTIGIPRTDADKCAAAKRAGSGWDASFYCPAGDFLSWMFSGPNSNASRGASGTW